MKDQLFDDFVKGKLEQYDSGAPMQVWEQIREKEKDDKKGFFFFKRYWLTGIALIALTGIALLTWNSGAKNNSAEQGNIISSQTKPTGNTKNSTLTAKNTIHKSDQQTESSIEKNTAAENNSTFEKQDLNTHSKNSPISRGPSSKFREPYLGNSISNKKNKGTFSNNGLTEVIQKDRTATSVDQGGKEQRTNSANTREEKEYALNFTGFAVYRNSFSNFLPGNVPQTNNRPGCPTINGPRRNDLYIEVYGSPDYTMRSFSNPSDLNNYIARRRSSEDNRNGFSAGVRIAKNIGEKTIIEAGVNYSQINERLRIINANEKQLTQIITIRTVIRAPGDTLFIRDTTYFEQNGTRYRTTYNRYRFIDLPVIFSYEFGNPEILAFSVNAGPVFNITSFYHGEVLDTTLTPVKISTAKGNGANNWRNNIGIGIFASFAVYKRINERLQIFGEPYFRYNFRPVTQSENFVHQRYTISGMQLGIRYNLYNGRQRYR